MVFLIHTEQKLSSHRIPFPISSQAFWKMLLLPFLSCTSYSNDLFRADSVPKSYFPLDWTPNALTDKNGARVVTPRTKQDLWFLALTCVVGLSVWVRADWSCQMCFSMLAPTDRPKFLVRHWTPVRSVRQPPIQWVPASFPGGKVAWAWRWPFPYGAKFKNEWNYYSPYMPTVRGQGKLYFLLGSWARETDCGMCVISLSLPVLRGRCFMSSDDTRMRNVFLSNASQLTKEHCFLKVPK